MKGRRSNVAVIREAEDTVSALPQAVKVLRGMESQQEFAARFGRSQVWVSYVERGKRSPSVRDLESMSRVGLRLERGSWSVEVSA